METENKEVNTLSKSYMPYQQILECVQEQLRKSYALELSETIETKSKQDSVKGYIRQVLINLQIEMPNVKEGDLIERIFNDMTMFGFLTDYMKSGNIEEININAYNNVDILYRDGTAEKITDGFSSPQNAQNIVRRMIRLRKDATLDAAKPIAQAYLDSTTRITAVHDSLLDENVGVGASIRFVSPAMQTREVMLNGTMSEEMLDFLQLCLLYKKSMCIAGSTGSGKTNTAGYLLSTLPDDWRIITLEEGSREVDLVKLKDGKPTNNVVQMITKDGEKNSTTLDDLLRVSLRFDPDVIFVGEMRSVEAARAQEASRTDHTVITTTHAKGATAIYDRIVTLAQPVMNMSEEYVLKLVADAFPICVYQEKCKDKKRRVMQIIETLGTDGKNVKINVLFQFVVTNTIVPDINNPTKNVTIEGYFKKVNSPSEAFIDSLRQASVPESILKKLKGE